MQNGYLQEMQISFMVFRLVHFVLSNKRNATKACMASGKNRVFLIFSNKGCTVNSLKTGTTVRQIHP